MGLQGNPIFAVGNDAAEGRKLILAGHGVFMNDEMYNKPDNINFTRNCIDWFTRSRDKKVYRPNVMLYVDGQLIIRLSLRFDTLLTLRSAELGNWGVPIPGSTDTYAVRNLNGRMDEFALFDSALKEEEIRACYAAGAP